MNILILCETSHNTSREFRRLWHDARSLDLLPPDNPLDEPFHIQADMGVFCAFMNRGDWDVIIAHPTCTYLTSAAAWAFMDPDHIKYPGVGYHQKVKPETLTGKNRREAREAALDDVRMIMALPCEKIVVENPRGCIGTNIDAREYGFPNKGKTQTIHPYQFGCDASKTTDLWIKGLPGLTPTDYVKPRIIDGRPRWSNQTDSGQSNVPPSKDRWKHRSITYPGISRAMALQWGNQ